MEMDTVRKGRRKIILMKEYLAVCRIASEQKILLSLASRYCTIFGYFLAHYCEKKGKKALKLLFFF
jgi:hypothetical protein